METVNSINTRVSVREYQFRPIEKEILIKLIDAGRRAPSARAVEPWNFVIVQNRKTLAEISRLADSGRFIKNAAVCIAVFCKDTKYYLEDGCAATENILIAASDFGLGACWVAADKKPYVNDVRQLLGAPGEFRLVSLISLGWPKNQPRQEKKRLLEEVIHWERF